MISFNTNNIWKGLNHLKESLSVLIEEYEKGDFGLNWHKEYLEFYKKFHKNEIIEKAVFAKMQNDKVYPHRYRIKKSALQKATHVLNANSQIILQSNTFDNLLKSIKQSTEHIKGFGILSKYDTALRIGYTLGLVPNKIYLHAGVRVGARNLLGNNVIKGRQYLRVDELPIEIQHMDPHHIENFLCKFKDRLHFHA